MAGIKVPQLRAIRQAKVMSQAELATKAGVSRVTVGKIENGGDAFPETIRKLAKALDVKASDLVKAI